MTEKAPPGEQTQRGKTEAYKSVRTLILAQVRTESKEISMKDDKIQTGLRIPQRRYEELTALASEMGVSLNSLILMLVDFGLTLRNGRIILHQSEG